MVKEVKVIIGANYGDEGKGLATDYFCSRAIKEDKKVLNVLTNGSAQRGHTVETPDGIRHVFHHFGSGSLAGAFTACCDKFLINPMEFSKEYTDLITKGVPHLLVHPDCRVVTPFDMMANQIMEESRGKKKHGSCGMGVWETILRKVDLRYRDLIRLSMDELRTKLFNIRAYYECYRLARIPDNWKSIWKSHELIEMWLLDAEIFMHYTELFDYNDMSIFDTVVFENGQGLLLDQRYGAHSTPTPTGLEIAADIVDRYIPYADLEAVYVTRPYLTRHGAGPFPTECKKEAIGNIQDDQTNVFNIHQDHIRYGEMDDGLVTRIADDTRHGWKQSIFLTHLNELPDSFLKDTANYMTGGRTRDNVIEMTD